MARRRRPETREILPDAKFGNKTVAQFINYIMIDGKKSVAERILYTALETIDVKIKDVDAIEVLETAIANVRPDVEVRSRRVGGATYQIPTEVAPKRAMALALRWLINFSRKRSEKTMADRLAGELNDAFNGKGNSIKKREDGRKMAEANRAFAHFKW